MADADCRRGHGEQRARQKEGDACRKRRRTTEPSPLGRAAAHWASMERAGWQRARRERSTDATRRDRGGMCSSAMSYSIVFRSHDLPLHGRTLARAFHVVMSSQCGGKGHPARFCPSISITRFKLRPQFSPLSLPSLSVSTNLPRTFRLHETPLAARASHRGSGRTFQRWSPAPRGGQPARAAPKRALTCSERHGATGTTSTCRRHLRARDSADQKKTFANPGVWLCFAAAPASYGQTLASGPTPFRQFSVTVTPLCLSESTYRPKSNNAQLCPFLASELFFASPRPSFSQNNDFNVRCSPPRP